MNHKRSGASPAVAIALLAGWPLAVSAQDAAPPGLLGTLSFSQSLELTDNPDFVEDPDGTALVAHTALSFGLESVTRVQTFRASIGVQADGDLSGTTAGDDFEIVSETAGLDYIREGKSARLSLGATYVETDIDDLVLDFETDTLVFDAGFVKRVTVEAGLDTGIDAPVGLSLDARYTNTDYIDTIDPDLTDSTRFSLDGVTRFRINPSLTAKVLAGYSRVEEDDGADSTTTRRYVGLGLEGDLRRGLTFSTDITYDRVEDSDSGTEDGAGFSFSLTQDLPSGSIGADVSSRIDDSGRLTRASVRRAVELKGGALSFALGVIDPEDADIRPTASLDFERETKRGSLNASLTQTPTSDDGDTVLNTSLRLNYAEAINSVSSWSAGISYAESNNLGGSEDTSLTSATVSYRRDLTEDWDLSAGYSYTLREEDGAADRSENSLFLSVERDVSFGF